LEDDIILAPANSYKIIDNIVMILDVTGLNVANIVQNSQEMPIFVPSVLTFNDYYPFGML